MKLESFVNNRDKIFNNKNRRALLKIIQDEPGIHFREIINTLEMANGTAAYHLKVLENNNCIKTVNEGNKSCFYPYPESKWQ